MAENNQTKRVNPRSPEEESLKAEMNDIREDLAILREDLGDLTAALKDLASQRVSDAKGRGRAQVDQARESLRQSAETAERQGREALGAFEHRVEERPLTSLLTVFGVGFVVAKLLDLGNRR